MHRMNGEDETSSPTQQARKEWTAKRLHSQSSNNLASRVGGLALCATPTNADERQKVMAKRHRVATELCDTEQTYVSSLALIHQGSTFMEYVHRKFIQPLSEGFANKDPKAAAKTKKKALVTMEEHNVLFGLHLGIMKGLHSRLAKWNDRQLIADVFVDVHTSSNFSKLYSFYVTNFNNSLNLLQEIKSNKSHPFTKWCFEIEATLDLNNLEAYLIMPVQRLPRYLLLLEDIARNTEKSHPDYSNLVTAHMYIKRAADSVNTSEYSMSKMDRVKQVASKIEDFPTTALLHNPDIYIVKSGLLMDLVSNQRFFVVLFSSFVVLSTITPDRASKFKFWCSMLLTSCTTCVTQSAEGDPALEIKVYDLQNMSGFIVSKDMETKELALFARDGFRFVHLDVQQLKLWYTVFVQSQQEAGAQVLQNGSIRESASTLPPDQQNKMRRTLVVEYLSKLGEYCGLLQTLYKFQVSLTPELHKYFAVAQMLFQPAALILAGYAGILTGMKKNLESAQYDLEKLRIADVFLENFPPMANYQALFFGWYKFLTAYGKERHKADSNICGLVKDFESYNDKTLLKIYTRAYKRLYLNFFLISDLLRATSKKHPDYQVLCAMHTKLLALIDKVNQYKGGYFS